MRKYTPLNWSHLCQMSFDAIKITLPKSSILIFADPNQTYVLFTGASSS